jgi:hypothetical protein
MKGFRKIIVDGKLWWWKYIKSNVVAYLDETKEKRVIDLRTLTGLSWDQIERGHWKKYFSVTPKDIEKWLKEEVK